MTDEITKKDETTAIDKPRGSIFAAKKVGLAAKAEQAKSAYNPEQCENKIVILMDDSGSMGETGMKQAKAAIDAFLQSCSPLNTAIGLYGFSPNRRYKLTCDYIGLGILKEEFKADQGTPTYTTLTAIKVNESATRVVYVSDGQPTDGHYVEDVVGRYKEAKIPIDTVLIGSDAGADEMKWIAEQTGGMFLKFKEGETFAKAFKYLTPGYRGLLADPNFKKQIGAE